MNTLTALGRTAKAAAPALARATTAQKNDALLRIAAALTERPDVVLSANRSDVENAEKSGISAALIDRLRLTEERIFGIAEGVRQVAALPDPIGGGDEIKRLQNGLLLLVKRVPLGVVGMIYEARPNVTVDAAALTLKTGNAVILRGGKEAFFTNRVLVETMRHAILEAGLPMDAVQLVTDTSRESARQMMELSDCLDVLIPRGGAGLIRSVVENARVPVIETGVGNCHIYVADDADLSMAVDILENAKCQRPSVCNAAETLLVDEGIAADFLPLAKTRLDTSNVEWRGCDKTREILGDSVLPATEDDYYTEFNDYILAVKVVSGLSEALSHIATFGSKHSEAIVTKSYETSRIFLDEVDAAAVYTNASTRFTDGFEFGLGAEIGISTQKMHARGPMGLLALTSTKHVIYGSGQIR